MGRPADESMFGRVVAGKYVVEAYVGGGAMGTVYRAHQRDVDRAVAVKILHRELLVEPTFVARFKREARAASRLDHPNSVRVFDYGQEPDGLCFIVMELLEGHSLFHVLRDEGPLPRRRMVDILGQILAALSVAHENGIVHRDLKPENILVERVIDDEGHAADRIKVCDFGMAKIGASREDAQKGSEMFTSHGVVVGTPEYMAPEQGRGEPPDGRTDLYAVGVILYQMLAGHVPFTADTAVAVLLKHITEEPVPPSRLVEGVDPGLEAICLKAMSKRPDDRYGSAREMRAELQAVLAADAIPVVRPARPRVISVAAARPEAETQALRPESAATQQTHALPRTSSAPPPPPKRSALPLVLGLVAAGAAVYAGVRFSRGGGATAAVAVTGTEVGAGAGAGSATGTGAGSGIGTATGTGTGTGTATGTGIGVASGSAGLAASGSAAAPAVAVATGSGVAPATGTAAGGLAGTAPTGTKVTAAAGTDAVPTASAGASAAGTQATAPATASSPAASPSASTGGEFAAARVVAGAVRCDNASGASVLAALPVGSFSACYRDALRSSGGAAGDGAGSLHLGISADGWITTASFAGPPGLAGAGQCIGHAAAGSGRKVHDIQGGGGASADVDLTFRRE